MPKAHYSPPIARAANVRHGRTLELKRSERRKNRLSELDEFHRFLDWSKSSKNAISLKINHYFKEHC
jgi:hypothetical protein